MTTNVFSIVPTTGSPYPTEVKGESSYKSNLLQICGEYDQDDGYDDDTHAAELILENENAHDANAVRVAIDDLTVGYLARTDALRYRKRLVELEIAKPCVGVTTASIKGGFLKDGEVTDFGVRLAFLPGEFEIEKLNKIEPLAAPTLEPKPKRVSKSVGDVWNSGLTGKIAIIAAVLWIIYLIFNVFSGR